MLDKQVEIYALSDPRDLQNFRYIGQSVNARYRLKQHIKVAKQGLSMPVCQWIRKLLSENVLPVVTVLKIVPGDRRNDAEIYQIDLAKEMGFDLLNAAEGGQTRPLSFHHSEETKKRLSIASAGNTNSKGKKKSQEAKEKLRIANLGKHLSEEHKRSISKGGKGVRHHMINPYKGLEDEKHRKRREYNHRYYAKLEAIQARFTDDGCPNG